MSEAVFINANEFIETLKAQGLCIVSASEFEAHKEILRRKIMRRNSLTLKEIVDHKLLPLTTKKGVEDWILKKKIKPEEVIRESDGKKRILVLTSAITRLGYGV
jgi:flagella basal body P-ring formation protein FlgA